jgi:hypothetical protein
VSSPRYSPNCDRPLAERGDVLACDACGIEYVGRATWHYTLAEPAGEAARVASWNRALARFREAHP